MSEGGGIEIRRVRCEHGKVRIGLVVCEVDEIWIGWRWSTRGIRNEPRGIGNETS